MTATYRLSEEGRKASLLAGGDGRIGGVTAFPEHLDADPCRGLLGRGDRASPAGRDLASGGKGRRGEKKGQEAREDPLHSRQFYVQPP